MHRHQHGVWKSKKKVAFNIASEASYVYILSGQKFIKNAKNGPIWWVLKTKSLRSNSVTRKVIFHRSKIGGKCQNWTIEMRHFGWFCLIQNLLGHPLKCMQLSSNRKSSKMFQFAKKLWKKKWFSTCIIITEERAGIFTFLQFQPQEFTLLQDCMIKMNFSVYTKDDHFNWPLLHINFLSWNSFTNMMKNWHESLGADEFL